MARLDVLYLALIGIAAVVDHFVIWRGFVRRSPADPVRARTVLWTRWMTVLWTLTAAGAWVWRHDARPWELLRLVPPHGWRLWVAVTLVLVLILTYMRRVIRIAQSTRVRRVKMGHPNVERLVPHDSRELRWWIALSCSAGFCEEFIFRGFLIAAVEPAVGLGGAAALSIVAFGAAHAYQGVRGVVSTGAVGTILTFVVLASGSLLPAMVMHAVIDIGEGLVGWLVMRRPQPGLKNRDDA